MDHKKVASEILSAIGSNNIKEIKHCATRLRMVLINDEAINMNALDNNTEIKGSFKANGMFQLIIGPGDVNKVFNEIQLQLENIDSNLSTNTDNTAQINPTKTNVFLTFIKVLSDIFVPIIPALVAGGLIMAINNVLTAKNLFGPQSITELFPQIADLADFINILAVAPFAFLPILIGYSATNRFGGNPYLGASLGMAMVFPSLVNGYGVANAIAHGTMEYWNILGFQVAKAGYQGAVIPVLAVSFILSKIEIYLHKKIPQAFDFIFTPMIAIILTGFLTFTLVGPFMREISDVITHSFVWLYSTTGAIGCGIFGLFYAPIVITGLHQSFPAIETTLLANIVQTGGSFIFPIAAMSNVAQGGACLAIYFITKDIKQKSLASSASVSALLGITEPAMFGINLKLKYPFFCAIIASACASIFIGFFKVLAVALGAAGIIGFISIAPNSIPMYLIGIFISFIISFGLTFIYSKYNK